MLSYLQRVLPLISKRFIQKFSDIDECATDNGGCSQVCVNKPGTSECKCNDGYVLADDKRTCLGNTNSYRAKLILKVTHVLWQKSSRISE